MGRETDRQHLVVQTSMEKGFVDVRDVSAEQKQVPLPRTVVVDASFSEAPGPNDLSNQARAFELSVHPLGDAPNKCPMTRQPFR